MLIELLDANENIITRIRSDNPETEFTRYFQDMYKATSWREAELLPTTQPTTQPTKNPALAEAENAFISFCESIGFEGKASSTEIQALCEAIKDEALAAMQNNDMETCLSKTMQVTEIGLKALALMNNVRELGGTWESIEWNEVE